MGGSSFGNIDRTFITRRTLYAVCHIDQYSYKLKFMKKVRHWFFSCTNATMISGKKKQIKQKLRRGNLKKMFSCVFHLFAWRHKQRCDCTTWFHNSETTVNPRQNLAGCSSIAPVSGCHRLSFFCAEMLPYPYVTIHLQDFRNMW